jgi:hypothetical protein
MVSWAHNVAPKGYYIAIVSTIAEGDSNHHLELQAGFDRLGKIEEKFMGPPIPIYEPLESGEKDNIFISRSYDATSHFETTTGKTGASKLTAKTNADMMAQMISVMSTEEQRATSWWLRVCVRDRTWLPKSKLWSMREGNQQRECYNCSFFFLTFNQLLVPLTCEGSGGVRRSAAASRRASVVNNKVIVNKPVARNIAPKYLDDY